MKKELLDLVLETCEQMRHHLMKKSKYLITCQKIGYAEEYDRCLVKFYVEHRVQIDSFNITFQFGWNPSKSFEKVMDDRILIQAYNFNNSIDIDTNISDPWFLSDGFYNQLEKNIENCGVIL